MTDSETVGEPRDGHGAGSRDFSLPCTNLPLARSRPTSRTSWPAPVRRAWSGSRFTGRRSKAIWKGMPSTATCSSSCRRVTHQRNRRYPVVYALHGYSIGAEQWSQEIHVPQTIEGAFAKGAREMIVVLPDSKTVHNGSMYSSSVTTGDFENFIAQDVVAYIDAHYRTIPNRSSRGLVGHSMGGYGASRIGMKHADVFGSLYIMSPCCLSPRGRGPANPENDKALAAVKTRRIPRSCPSACVPSSPSAAAWSPNPNNPPLYLDLPIGRRTSRKCWPSGRPTRRWPSSISTSGACGSIGRSRSTSATRTACASMPASCTTCSRATASPTIEIYPERTPAPSPSAYRTTCCRSSARPVVRNGQAVT